MIGYHSNPGSTAKAVDTERWIHRGDLGTMDARGYVRIIGRVNEMIIRGGENHFLAEIDIVFLENPIIAEFAVVGQPAEKWGEIIFCYARSEGRQPLDVLELHRYCRDYKSSQKSPTIWCQVKEFPLTGSGKIQKFTLRYRLLTGE